MTACNASGACSFAYGATRRHISGITLVLANGETLALKRGQKLASGRNFKLMTSQGREISGPLPEYTSPEIKSAAGYHIKPGMDLIDLFIGSEGTLGLITEVELALTPAPDALTGIICFFSNECQTLDFVSALRTQRAELSEQLNAIEYFDDGALRLIQSSTPRTGLLLPPGKPQWKNALYIEWAQSSQTENQHLTLVSQLMQSCGATADDTWLAADAPGLKRMKAFRHAVPEQINSIIAERKQKYPELTKLGTDLSVSAEHGIGRLKKELLAIMYGESHIQAMRDLKALFDPGFILNPGRLFEAEIQKQGLIQ